MEKYSKAVGEMYSQFKQKEAHPMEKYIGRFVSLSDDKAEVEVVGYRDNEYAFPLIVDASKTDGWYGEFLDPQDVVAKKCKKYWYASINELID